MNLHLRVFPAPDDSEDYSFASDQDQPRQAAVRVKLGELMPMLALAQKVKSIWLKDFLDDEVLI